MTHLEPEPPPRNDSAGQTCGVALVAILGMAFLLVMIMVLAKSLGSASNDPHGYGTIFSSMLAIPLALVLAVVVPLMFPRPQRARAYGVSLSVFVVVLVVVIISWSSAS